MIADSIFISKAIGVIGMSPIQTASAQALAKAIHQQDPELETRLMTEFGKRLNYAIYESFLPEIDILKTTEHLRPIPWAQGNVICTGNPQREGLCLAVWNPFTIKEQEALQQKMKAPIQWKLTSWSYIQMIWTHILRQDSATDKSASKDSLSKSQNRLCQQKSYMRLRQMIEEAFGLNASDIHFISHKTYVDISLRINGYIQKWARLSKKEYQEIWNTCHLLAHATPKSTPFQDLKFILRIDQKRLPLRFSSIQAISGKSTVLRLLTERYLEGYHHLGFNPAQIKHIENLLKNRNGLILICGPTGSGKSTTAYNFLIHLSKRAKKIISIEDPVEIQLPDTTQINISPAQNFSYQDAIRASLRQNPDVIYIGEIRDPETAKLSFHAANSGHLVITTFHSSEISHCQRRLQHLGISDDLFQNTLLAAIFQRLGCKDQVSEAKANYRKSSKAQTISSPKTYQERSLIATIHTPEPSTPSPPTEAEA